MSPPQAHNPGCIVPAGSDGSRMPVELSSKREKKIVSPGTISVLLPGGGFKALSQTIIQILEKKLRDVLSLGLFFFLLTHVTISNEILHECGRDL